MRTWLGTALGSLIFGWAALVASAAEASVKPVNYGSGDAKTEAIFKPCTDKAFSTQVAAQSCLLAMARAASSYQVVTGTSNFVGYKSGSECVAAPDRLLYGRFGAGVYFSGNNIMVGGEYYGSPTGAAAGQVLYADGSCERKWSQYINPPGVIAYFRFETSSEPADDEVPDPVDPDKPKECVLNAEWGRRGIPQRAAGYKPVAGNKFKVAYRTDFAQPATVTDGGTTAPGHLFEVDMGDNHACTFRRQTRVHLPSEDPNGVGTMVYTADYFPRTGGAVGDQGSGADVPEIVVKANTKVSKPIVKYGTAFDANRIAKALDSLERAVNQRYGTSCGANCRTADGQPVPVTVQATQEVSGVPFVHPAPAQLLRDNPDCVAKFDPRCAFSPSPTVPATPQTPPNTLVRISNDGTNIVQNDTTVYNNTVYPQSMRDAGTAPSAGTPGNTSPPGSVDSPGGAEEGEGGGGEMIDACRASGECTPSDEKVAAYLDAIGVDRNKDTSPDGVASSVIDKAMGNGTCTSTNQNAFCSLAAGFGARMNRPVPAGDLVIAEGDLKLWDRMSHQKITLNRKVLDFIKLLLKIMTVLSTIHIVLRGRPF